MKQIKFISILLLTTMFLGFTSCSDDDDPKEDHLIVGRWRLVRQQGNIHTHLEFKNDGTFEYTSTEEADYKEVGVYKIEDDILSQMFSDEDHWHKTEISELTKTVLKLTDGWYNEEDAYTETYLRED